MPINSYDNYPLTWRPDKQKLKRPYYRSLIQQLEQDILKNKLQKNTQLPSQRELADYLDLNFTTVARLINMELRKVCCIRILEVAHLFLPMSLSPSPSLPMK